MKLSQSFSGALRQFPIQIERTTGVGNKFPTLFHFLGCAQQRAWSSVGESPTL